MIEAPDRSASLEARLERLEDQCTRAIRTLDIRTALNQLVMGMLVRELSPSSFLTIQNRLRFMADTAETLAEDGPDIAKREVESLIDQFQNWRGSSD